MGLKEVQKSIGIKFENVNLLREALTHPSSELSYSYERLEFLGDAVLNLVIAEMLFDLFPQDTEGSLSKKHVELVRRKTLAEISQKIGLGNHIILSNSEENTGGRQKASNLENVLEGLIAAIFLDAGMKTVRDFIYRHWYEKAKSTQNAPTNPKNVLQEIVQNKNLPLPVYKLIQKSGPDHDPIFTIEVQVEGKSGIGVATSKKAAQQEAAKNLLTKIVIE